MVIAPAGSASDESKVRAAEERIFAAITARDASALAKELAADFVLSSPGKPDQSREDFLQAIASMPYQILEVGGEHIRCRLLGDVAVLSGVQRARVAIAPGNVVVARTAFADLFVRDGNSWRLRHAFGVELPTMEPK
jgi:uncharacterized protein (TIGR02246 family)